MTYPSIKKLLRSPAGGLAIALFASLLLASLASAGLNTLVVARILIAASFILAVCYVCLSENTARMRWRQKVFILSAIGISLIALERVETWAQPKRQVDPPFPAPPLLLMLDKGPIRRESDTPLTRIPGLSVFVSSINRPQGGYSGFGGNDEDDPMLGIPDVDLFNPTNRPIALSWELKVEGEGRSFTLKGDGRGRWERQLNKNDFVAETRKKVGGSLGWLLSPTTIGPNAKLSFKQLGFVAPDVGEDTKRLIESNGFNDRFKFTLIFTDLQSGVRSAVVLPFGQPPTKTYKSEVEWIQEMAREQGLELNTETGETRRITNVSR